MRESKWKQIEAAAYATLDGLSGVFPYVQYASRAMPSTHFVFVLYENRASMK
jgi:hypothetical protein